MKKYLPFLVAALASTGAGAATLTPDQALARLGSDGPVRVAGARLNLAMTENIAGTQTPAVYVFNSDNGGYVVVSADDRAVPMLGYADEGALDAENMAPALKYWLGEYARQIAAAVPATGETLENPAKVERAPIAPMTTTRWDQGEPYNNQCPLLAGTRTFTGCVATAMAQVMKYHNYPAQGTGSHSYYWSKGSKNLSINFSSINFDWDNMLNTYTGSATTAQKNAVAMLMKACGYAVDMGYGTDASGAFSVDVPYALYDYFSYSKGMSYCNHDYYTAAEWEDLVYAQLAYGPVYYSGQSNGGGHAFVCDGYSNNGYFHFNWGWSGYSDGYFLLNALSPEDQGIGGSTTTDGFNYMQAISAGICPPSDNDAPVYNFTCTGMNTGIPRKAKLGSALKMSVTIANVGVAPVQIQPGVKVVAADGTVTYLESNAYASEVEPEGTSALVSVTFPADMAAGTYQIYPAVMDEAGNWHDVHMKLGGVRYLIGTVANGEMSLAKSEATTLTVQDFELVSPVYVNRPFEVKAKLVNNSDGGYIGIIAPILYRNGVAYAYGDYSGVEVAAGSTFEFDYFGRFTRGSNPSAGSNYEIALFDISTNKEISSRIPVTIKSGATTGRVTASNLVFVGNADAADNLDLNFSFDFTCTGGYFSDRLSIRIFPLVGTIKKGEIATDPIFADAGTTKTIAVNGAVEDLVVGTSYRAAVYNGNTKLTDYARFKVATSGIEIIEGEDTVLLYPNPTSGVVNLSQTSDADVYSLAGALVQSVKAVDTLDLSDLPSGMYLVKIGNKVHRVIKK